MTALREVARRAGRYAVEVADVAVAPVSVETIAELGLRVGRLLDAEGVARLAAASAVTACYDQALDALARKARSARELERWLARRGHRREAIELAKERLLQHGLLDDLAFARVYARSRVQGRSYGARRVEAELARLGVDPAHVRIALADVRDADPEAERETLVAAARRRMRTLGRLDPTVAERRLLGWLVRRGFAIAEARAVARDVTRQ